MTKLSLKLLKRPRKTPSKKHDSKPKRKFNALKKRLGKILDAKSKNRKEFKKDCKILGKSLPKFTKVTLRLEISTDSMFLRQLLCLELQLRSKHTQALLFRGQENLELSIMLEKKQQNQFSTMQKRSKITSSRELRSTKHAK